VGAMVQNAANRWAMALQVREMTPELAAQLFTEVKSGLMQGVELLFRAVEARSYPRPSPHHLTVQAARENLFKEVPHLLKKDGFPKMNSAVDLENSADADYADAGEATRQVWMMVRKAVTKLMSAAKKMSQLQQVKALNTEAEKFALNSKFGRLSLSEF